MSIKEFLEALKGEYEVIMFTEMHGDAVVTVKAWPAWDNDRSCYMVGTYEEAMECGYPIDGLMNITRTLEEATATHMSLVAAMENEKG